MSMALYVRKAPSHADGRLQPSDRYRRDEEITKAEIMQFLERSGHKDKYLPPAGV